jgi:hypothetical protein
MGLTAKQKSKIQKTKTDYKKSGLVVSVTELKKAKALSTTEPLTGETEIVSTNAKGTTTFLLYLEDSEPILVYTKTDPDEIPEEFIDQVFNISGTENQYYWWN